jgi:hypothetical protein
MNNYENTKHKIRKIYNDLETVENDSDILKTGNIKILSSDISSKRKYILIADESTFLPIYKEFNFTFKNNEKRIFPDIRIIPILSTSEGYENELSEKILRPSIQKYFTQEDNNTNLFFKIDISEITSIEKERENFDIILTKRFFSFGQEIDLYRESPIYVNEQFRIYRNSSGKLGLKVFSGSQVKGEYILTNSWDDCQYNKYYNLRFVRKGDIVEFYIDGVKKEITTLVAFTHDIPVYIAIYLTCNNRGDFNELRPTKT